MATITINPEQSIQPVINSSSTHNGDILYIKDGLHHELITITKEISLTGQSKNAIVDGTDFVPYLNQTRTQKIGSLVNINANNVNLNNLTIRNSNNNLVKLNNTINTEIQNCLITKSFRSGIWGNGKNWKIHNNEISWNHYICIIPAPPAPQWCNELDQEGISVGNRNWEFNHNWIHDCGITLDGTQKPRNAGMYIKGDNNNGKVHHNFFQRVWNKSIYIGAWCATYGHRLPSFCNGIYDQPLYNMEIYKNIIRDCDVAYTIVNEAGGTTQNIYFHDNIATNCNRGFMIAGGGASADYPGYMDSICFKNNISYNNNLDGFYINKDEHFGIYPNNFCSSQVPVLITGNIIANNHPNITFQSGLPSNVYNSDWNTVNIFTLTQADFNTKYNQLYNEIFTQPTLSTITITPNNIILTPGQTKQLNVTCES